MGKPSSLGLTVEIPPPGEAPDIQETESPLELDLTRPMPGESPGSIYLLARMMHDAGDHEAALDSFIELAKTHPGTAVFYDMAVQYRALRRYEESLTPLSLVLSTEPMNLMAWINAADSTRQMGRLEGAAQLFRRALVVAEQVGQPAHVAIVCHNLSVTLWDLNDHDGARSFAERAVHLSPLDDHYRMHLASLQLAVDDYANGWPNYEARLGMDRDEKAENSVKLPARDEIFPAALKAHDGAEPQTGKLDPVSGIVA